MGGIVQSTELGTRAIAVLGVLVDMQASILQGQRISFRHSPIQSLHLQIYRFQFI